MNKEKYETLIYHHFCLQVCVWEHTLWSIQIASPYKLQVFKLRKQKEDRKSYEGVATLGGRAMKVNTLLSTHGT